MAPQLQYAYYCYSTPRVTCFHASSLETMVLSLLLFFRGQRRWRLAFWRLAREFAWTRTTTSAGEISRMEWKWMEWISQWWYSCRYLSSRSADKLPCVAIRKFMHCHHHSLCFSYSLSSEAVSFYRSQQGEAIYYCIICLSPGPQSIPRDSWEMTND